MIPVLLPIGVDIAATVLRPLAQESGKVLHVAPFSVVVDPAAMRAVESGSIDPATAYIYRLQIREADILLLNKCDAEADPALPEAELSARCPTATVLRISAATGDGIAAWLDAVLAAARGGGRRIEVDYDIYAAGEAALGWLNATVGWLNATVDLSGSAMAAGHHGRGHQWARMQDTRGRSSLPCRAHSADTMPGCAGRHRVLQSAHGNPVQTPSRRPVVADHEVGAHHGRPRPASLPPGQGITRRRPSGADSRRVGPRRAPRRLRSRRGPPADLRRGCPARSGPDRGSPHDHGPACSGPAGTRHTWLPAGVLSTTRPGAALHGYRVVWMQGSGNGVGDQRARSDDWAADRAGMACGSR